MPSVRSIAKQAGVSIATVSRALNNEAGISPITRDRVLAVAQRRGYKGGNGRRMTTSVAFAYTGEQKLSHPFESAVLQGVAQAADESEFNITLLNLSREKGRGESHAQFLKRMGVGGVILRVVAESRDICQSIASDGFPHVVISERFEGSDVNYVDCDSKQNSIKAIKYLLSLGHKRIAFAAHNIPDRDHTDRFEGYREALEREGIPFRRELAFSHPSSISGGATVVKMAVSMAERPTAIYFADWMLAAGGLKAAHELGLQVPGDLSIIGFDDAFMRHAIHPTMTAVCQNAVQLGNEAGKRLAKLMSGQDTDPFQITIPSFFEINESTGIPVDSPMRVSTKERLVVAEPAVRRGTAELPDGSESRTG